MSKLDDIKNKLKDVISRKADDPQTFVDDTEDDNPFIENPDDFADAEQEGSEPKENKIKAFFENHSFASDRGEPSVRKRTFTGKMEPKQRLRFIYLSGVAMIALVCVIALIYAAVFSKDARYTRELERGKMYLENNQYQQAIESYDIVLKIDGTCTEGYLGRAESYASINDYANAEKDYQKALELAPTDYDIYLSLAQVMVAQTKTDDAIRVLQNGYAQTTHATIYDMLYELKSESGNTNISGYVNSYASGVVGAAAAGAKVSLYDRKIGRDMAIAYTDAEGAYSFNTVPGDYTLSVAADGCVIFNYDVTISEGQKLSMERVLLINENDSSGNGTVQIIIKDASSGDPKDGVSVNLRQGWNCSDGEYIFDTPVLTNENGVANVGNIPAGYYTMVYTCDGYIAGTSNVTITANATIYSTDVICEILPDDYAMIVLTWGKSVTDLDLNVRGTDKTKDDINVYFGNRGYDDGNTVRVMLTCKNSTGYGPETVNIRGGVIGDGYTLIVHDYDNRAKEDSQALSNCEAQIRIYVGDHLEGSIIVPGGNVGTYWTACSIDNNWNITPINTFSNSIDE